MSKSILPKSTKPSGSERTVRFSKGTLHSVKNRERKGPTRGVIQKCDPQERSPCAPKFEDGMEDKTLTQERCARREAWDWAEHVHKLTTKGQGQVVLAYRSLGNAGTLSEATPEERICGRLQSINAHTEPNGSKFSRTGNPSETQ